MKNFFAISFLLLFFACTSSDKSPKEATITHITPKIPKIDSVKKPQIDENWLSEQQDKILFPEKYRHLALFQKKCAHLYVAKTPAKPGEWLAEHTEHYQSPKDYQTSKPVRPDSVRKHIYIMLLDDFSPQQKAIIQETLDYLRAFYGLEVKQILPPQNANIYKSSRINADSKKKQLYTIYLMDSVLHPNLPQDAAVMIGLTSIDLYPNPTWNFVFGQASLQKRVGIWSMNRFGNPAESKKMYDLCRIRTFNTATHEIGHMFSISHCTKYECCMNGSNHERESDSRPTWFCVECLSKLCWNLKYDVKTHLQKTSDFWEKKQMYQQATFYKQNLKTLGN